MRYEPVFVGQIELVLKLQVTPHRGIVSIDDHTLGQTLDREVASIPVRILA
jgi:hypothetical protein